MIVSLVNFKDFTDVIKNEGMCVKGIKVKDFL